MGTPLELLITMVKKNLNINIDHGDWNPGFDRGGQYQNDKASQVVNMLNPHGTLEACLRKVKYHTRNEENANHYLKDREHVILTDILYAYNDDHNHLNGVHF